MENGQKSGLIWYSGKRTVFDGPLQLVGNQTGWEDGHLFGRYLVCSKCVTFQPAMVILFWYINMGFCQIFFRMVQLHCWLPSETCSSRRLFLHITFTQWYSWISQGELLDIIFNAKHIQQNDKNPHVCSFIHRLVEVCLNTEVTKSFLNLFGNLPPAIQFCCCTSGVWCRKNVVIPVMGDSASHRIIKKQSKAKIFAGFPGKLSRKKPVTHMKREGFWTELASKLSFFPETNDGKALKSSDFLPDEIPPRQVMHCDLASHLAPEWASKWTRGMWILGEGLVCFLSWSSSIMSKGLNSEKWWMILPRRYVNNDFFMLKQHKCIASKLVPDPTLAIKWLVPSLNCCWRIPDGIYLRITPATTDNQTAKLQVMSNFYKVWFPVPFWSK